MTTVLSVISAKGGAGKTVLSLSLARFLAGVGFKVLVVDADASTNGATLFLLDEVIEFAQHEGRSHSGPPLGLFEQPLGRSLDFDVVPTSQGFGFVPAAFRLRNTFADASGAVDERMPDIVSKLRHSDVDVVIIDNEAGIEPSAVSSAAVSDRVVIVSEFDPISSQGIVRLQRLHADALPDERTWVLFNKVLPEFADSIGAHLVAIKYLPPVGWTADVIRRYAVNELDVDTERPTDFTLAIAKVAEVLFPSKVRTRIATWQADIGKRFEAALQSRRDLLREQLAAASRRTDRYDTVAGVGLMAAVGIAAISQFLFASAAPIGVWLALVSGFLAATTVFLRLRKPLPSDIEPPRLRQQLHEIELLLSPTRVDDVDLAELRRRIHAIDTASSKLRGD